MQERTGRRRRRTATLFVLLAFLTTLVAACGGQQAATPTAAVPTAAVIATPDTNSVPTESAANPDPPTPEPVQTPAETTSATPEPGSADLTFPLQSPYLEFGVVVHLYYTDRDRVLQLVQNADFDWVRQQVVWRDIEDPSAGIYAWEELDAIVNAVNVYDRKLLVNIVQAPEEYNPTHGLPAEPARLGDFVEKMVERYGNKIHAYEIWNEPNLAIENGGRITTDDVGHYVEILMEAYNRIKAANPSAIVLAAASSSTGVTDPSIALSDEDFYRAMYEYRNGIIDGHFDIQAVHPGGSANPPQTLYPENPSNAEGWTDHPTFYFRHVENVRRWMEEYGLGNHQIWITEFGWATENVTPGYEFGNQVSFEEQAEYINGAIRYAYDNYPWVSNLFLWNMNFAVLWNQTDPPQPLHEQASFGILNPDWSPRPSYLTVQSLIDQLKREQGRKE
jgi:polysaccharide biosynthesis protein PslG